MPTIDGRIDEEKLRELLDEQGESETLDYKSECDLSQRGSVVELAKDVGAMQILGGYVVVGADSNGRPSGRLTAAAAQLLDESRLRAKLNRYLPEPYALRSAVHDIDTVRVGVIFVGPNPKGWCIFRQDGTYEQPPGRQVVAF